MSARGERLFAEYAAAHSTRGNRVCHGVGIPLIVFSSLLALATLRVWGRLSAAEIAIAAVAAAALSLDAGTAVVFLLFLAVLDVAARLAISTLGEGPALAAAVSLFALGWAFQFVGHLKYEKNRPAFARNLVHLLVGPLWIAKKLLSVT